MSSRRSRIDIGDGKDESPAAKRRRQEATLKAAAREAARKALSSVTTVFFDDAPPSNAPAAASPVPIVRAAMQNGDATPAAGELEAQEPAARLFTSLVDYSHDGSSDDESSQDGQPQPQPQAKPAPQNAAGAASGSSAVGKPPASTASAAAMEAAPNASTDKSSIDAELESFMSDLESSGLLVDDTTASQQQPAAALADPHAPGSTSPGVGEAARGGAAAAPAVGAAREPANAVAAAEPQAAAAAAESAGNSSGEAQQAEQRVLGPLAGLPEWMEVMDMASRQVYFWHPPSNAVEWDPPPGGTPRDVSAEPAAAAKPATAVQPAHPAADSNAVAGAQPIGSAAAAAAAQPTSQPVQSATLAEPAREAEGGPAAVPRPQLPSAELAAQTAGLVNRLRTAAGSLFAAAPKLVWLAIEAEIRAKDLQLLGDLQRQAAAAADSSSGSTGLTWNSYEQHAAEQLRKLEEALPLATAEAAQLQAAATAAATAVAQAGLEEGEVRVDPAPSPSAPPLPAEYEAPLPPDAQSAPLLPDGATAPLPPEPAPTMLPRDEESAPVQLSVDEELAPLPEDVGGTAAASGAAASPLIALDAARPAALPGAAEQHIAAPQRALKHEASNIAAPQPQLALQPATAQPASPAAQATFSGEVDMDMEESPAAAAPQPTAQPAVSQPAAAATPAAGTPSSAAALAETTAAAPAALSGSVAPHTAPSSAWPMPVGGPGAMPFTWSFYYPPPYAPLQPFAGPHGPHTLPYPMTAFFGAPPHIPPHSGHAAVAAAAREPASSSAQAEAAPPLPGESAADAAPVPEPRREYRAEPVRAAPLAGDAANSGGEAPEQPPLPDAHEPPSQALLPAQLAKRAKAPVSGGLLGKKKGTKLAKGASSLINKWQAVKQDLKAAEEAEEAAEAGAADPAALERKRLAEAEEWRLQQLRSGQAAANVNFQPVAGDWREKIKAAKKEEKRAAKKAAKAKSSSAVDLDELSARLPQGWRAMRDPASGEIYFGNLVTKETSWDPPT